MGRDERDSLGEAASDWVKPRLKHGTIGYIYRKDIDSSRWIKVYWTIQELRLCCGEIPSEEIEKVTVIPTKKKESV